MLDVGKKVLLSQKGSYFKHSHTAGVLLVIRSCPLTQKKKINPEVGKTL